MEVKIEGAVLGESSTDAPTNLENTSQSTESERPLVENVPTDEERRSILPGDMTGADHSLGPEGFSPTDTQETSGGGASEMQDDKSERRNLDPDGKPDVNEIDSLEVSKPEDETDHEVKVSTDLNKNEVIEHEIPAANANMNQIENEEDSEEELPWAMYRNIKKNERASDAEDELSDDDEIAGKDE